ncbi:phage head morphogenesis protein [Gluconacetobacter entanii]|uniref:Phage head morphogenesis protein n=1 Tax=Gluconacetobacter entanii TaxID=108528 RepID=A0ABT3K2R2_9PROT|nr:hypothetical protein [Gluconacetobacter entanii]MCW4589402.1 phage head morphogenesis protein [Gluconacetobacter entanii]MCW4592508.1 phage head morphogenesis protein [Gluconacetobacter entanii]NPC87637.1 hypothetical protein [Gluconacetobacter entanii]
MADGVVAMAARLPPSDAIRFLRQKVNVPTERWGELEGEAHARSFAIAGAASDALLADFRKAMEKALIDGTTLEAFQKEFDSIKKRRGWDHTGTPGWRAEIIYSTNVSTAYSAGQYRQMTTPDALEMFPYPMRSTRAATALPARCAARGTWRNWCSTISPPGSIAGAADWARNCTTSSWVSAGFSGPRSA